MTHTTKNNNSNGGFFTGLLLGLLIGGLVVFALGTEKGKKLFKILSKEGLDKLSGLDEFLDEISDDEVKEDEELPVALPAKTLAKKPVVNAYTKAVDMIHPEPPSEVQHASHVSSPKPRRFFRGVKRV